MMLLGILFFPFSSCQTIIKTYAGVKKPKYENDVEVRSFLREKGIENALVLRPFEINEYARLLKGLRSPDVLMFNSQGYRMNFFEVTTCSAPVDDFVKNICAGTYINIDSARHLTKFFKVLKPMQESDSIQMADNLKTQPDFSVIIVYGKYLGWKLINENVVPWSNSLASNKNCIVHTYYLNLDAFSEELGKMIK